MLYQLRLDIANDRWLGFREERRRFIEMLCQRDIHGVYLLAGDLHSAHAMQVEIPGASGVIPLWEFCASPFEQNPTRMTGWRWMRKPLPEDLVVNQEILFTYNQVNFGLVEVNLEDPLHPEVGFSVYGADGSVRESMNTF